MSLIGRILDPNQPPVVVAELSGNHGQRFETAQALIRLAAEAGADAVKLQTYTADTLTLPGRGPGFVVQGGLWHGQALHDLYQIAATPYEWHRPLLDYAASLGLPLFSTPFDESAVDFLEAEIQPELYKISSFEVTHLPLLARTARTGKPVVMSTGMATPAEIAEAVAVLRANGCPQVVLLKCVSAYPADPADFNLRSLAALGETFDCPVGLSDHCLANDIAVAATALGARLIEKHFTDSRAAGAIDSGFSLEPAEFAALVQQTRRAHAALGSPQLETRARDQAQLVHRRSIYISQDIAAGAPLTPSNIKIVRPALGLAPKRWTEVLGKAAARPLSAGQPLLPGDFR